VYFENDHPYAGRLFATVAWHHKSRTSLHKYNGFVTAEGHAVLHTVFLDRNTFCDSPSVDREPWVGEVDIGVGVAYRGVRLTYAQILRTRELERGRKMTRAEAQGRRE